MLFSVLIPVYNVEKYLPECIYSVINQTEQDYEIILIDDGSTDSSGKICDAFTEQYPGRITVKHNANQGQLLTRIESMKFAHGEYFIHLDSDDTLRFDTLALVKKAIEQYHPDMIIYGLHRIGLDGTGTDQMIRSESRLYEENEKEVLYKIMCATSKLNNYVTKVVRREVALSSEMFLNYPQVRIGEDLLQSLPLMTNAKKIYYLAEPLYCYRKNSGSMTLGGAKNRYESESIVFAELIRYSALWGIYDEMFPIIQERYVSMCLDVLSLGSIKKQSKEEYHRLFRRIAKDELFASSKISVMNFPTWKKTMWKLVVTERERGFSLVWRSVQILSRLKKLLAR